MADKNIVSSLDDVSLRKNVTDVEMITAKEICNVNSAQDESSNTKGGDDPLEEITVGICSENNANKDVVDNSKVLEENLDNDHKSQPSINSNEQNSKQTMNSSLDSSSNIIHQTNADCDTSDKTVEVNIELQENSLLSQDSLVTNQNICQDENLKIVHENSDLKIESDNKLTSEDSVNHCFKVKNDLNEPLISKNIEAVGLDIDVPVSEYPDVEECIADKNENSNTTQPVILEVKSIASNNMETFSSDDLQVETAETMDSGNKVCEQVIKTERFEDDKKEISNDLNETEFEHFVVKSEIFEEEENISDVDMENELEDTMEVDENLEKVSDSCNEPDNFNIPEVTLKTKSKDELDDFILIEDCKSGRTNNSDSSSSKSFIKEGCAEILLSSPKTVFYNPVQEFNRDMSIAALTVFAEDHRTDPRYKNRGVKRKKTCEEESAVEEKNVSQNLTSSAGTKFDNGITILEALSATGLRSIRYAKEISGIKQIIANDISEVAVENIKKNAEHNDVGDIVLTSKSDASLLMYQRLVEDQLFDAVDLDPYGCPSRFLDAAVQAVRDGGMLLVTCTDMAVLAGNSPETCHAKYGSISLRNTACHEMAIRIALQCIESHANRYGRYIVPLLSFSADFYIRVIVQVYTSPVTCKKTTSKLSTVYQCVGCHALTLSPLGLATQVGNNQMKFTLPHSPPVNMCCSHCFYQHTVGGPIWSAPIHKSSFVERMLKVAETHEFGTSKRMQGMLEVIKEELPDVALYYTISGLCSKIHCTVIPIVEFRSALLNAGYRVSLSHASPNSIKTNAPVKTLWDIIRCWVQMNPISQRRLVDGSVSAAILFQEPTTVANFELHPKARASSRIRGLLRYQQNPQKNWGPGTRSRANVGDNLDERRRAKQNKNSNKKTPVEIIEVITLSNDEDEANI